jgi:hypothetical protein
MDMTTTSPGQLAREPRRNPMERLIEAVASGIGNTIGFAAGL